MRGHMPDEAKKEQWNKMKGPKKLQGSMHRTKLG
jgi:hypothetical protein